MMSEHIIWFSHIFEKFILWDMNVCLQNIKTLEQFCCLLYFLPSRSSSQLTKCISWSTLHCPWQWGPHRPVDNNYRKAPEHPFPVTTQDAENITHYISTIPTQCDPSDIFLSGFSSGSTIILITVNTNYKKSLECPFSTATQDAKDITHYISTNLAQYKPFNIFLNKFSSDSTTTLITTSMLGPKHIKGVIAIYLSVNLTK